MFPNRLLQQFSCVLSSSFRNVHTTDIMDRARVGTRLRKAALRKANKKEKIIQTYIPQKIKQEMMQVGKITKRHVIENPVVPIDNVYFMPEHQYASMTVAEAMELHREANHPTLANNPSAPIHAYIETSMSTKKKTQFMDSLRGLIKFPHSFETKQSHSVFAFVQDSEEDRAVIEAGAKFADGANSVKLVKSGKMNLADYDYIVCSSAMLPDLIPIRTILRGNFPNAVKGTCGSDVVQVVKDILGSYRYDCIRDKYDLDYGSTNAQVGTLEMSPEQIEENIDYIVKHIEDQKAKNKPDNMVTRIFITCPSGEEKFEVDHVKYLPALAVAK